ncbi:Dachshund [Trichinella spiralis]|uniref:Dachshund n=1 Tax=Trichinella spiralis TaxID=6334 RepID=A0ABR3KXW6_TRISP
MERRHSFSVQSDFEDEMNNNEMMLDDERQQTNNSKSFAMSKSNPTPTSPENVMEERLIQLMNIGNNGSSINATATGAVEAQLIEYRGQKVAAFRTDMGTLICLPQAYELFLKHLVGGLHTVYTKLKRLDVTPIVCNVEQVRALRSIGAIQPGVNRCKLISCHDFDTLLKDCATSNSRPGRPPKRSNSDALYHQSLLPDSLSSENSYTTINQQANALNEKQMKFSDKNSHGMNNSLENRNGPHGQMTSILGVASSQINNSLFPFLPMTPQQIFLTQMLGNNMAQNPFSVASTAAAAAANARSWTDIEALILGKSNSERTKTTNQESQLVDDGETSKFLTADLAQRQSTATEEECFSVNNNYTIENLLISASGMMELALATIRRVDSQQQKDKMEMLKALETEKRNRAHLENLLKEKEQSEKINAKCVKEMKATIADLQLRLSVCTQASNDSSIAQTSPITIWTLVPFPMYFKSYSSFKIYPTHISWKIMKQPLVFSLFLYLYFAFGVIGELIFFIRRIHSLSTAAKIQSTFVVVLKMTLETKITLKQSRQMSALNLTQTQHMAIGNVTLQTVVVA